MADSIIQYFLDNSFIKTDDPSHIENLKKASDEIRKSLKRKKANLITYTLVAFDPTITDDEPIIKEVEALIIKNWPTFVNSVVKTKDTPITYIQAVILEALNNISSDDNLASIIWLTGNNIINYYKLAGQAKILTSFLTEIGKRVDASGCNAWSQLESVKIASIAPYDPVVQAISPAKVGEAALQGHLIAASNHSGWAAQAGGGENPSHSAGGNHQWAQFFSTRAAKGLSAEINVALTSQNNSIAAVAKSIQETISLYLANLEPYFQEVGNSIIQSSESLRRRSELIWWKQSLYSTRLCSSYRSLQPLAASVALAVDLAGMAAGLYPRSVDYLLRETLYDLIGDSANSTKSVAELFAMVELFSDSEKKLLDCLLSDSKNRKPFGSCMAEMMNGNISTQDFFNSTGIEKVALISLSDLTVWLFHDLQANKLAYAK